MDNFHQPTNVGLKLWDILELWADSQKMHPSPCFFLVPFLNGKKKQVCAQNLGPLGRRFSHANQPPRPLTDVSRRETVWGNLCDFVMSTPHR